MNIGYYLIAFLSIQGQPAQVHTWSFSNVRACFNAADEMHGLGKPFALQTMCVPKFIAEEKP